LRALRFSVYLAGCFAVFRRVSHRKLCILTGKSGNLYGNQTPRC
jgi:hypothetical protein